MKKNKPAFQGRLYHLPPIESNRKTTSIEGAVANPNPSPTEVILEKTPVMIDNATKCEETKDQKTETG